MRALVIVIIWINELNDLMKLFRLFYNRSPEFAGSGEMGGLVSTLLVQACLLTVADGMAAAISGSAVCLHKVCPHMAFLGLEGVQHSEPLVFVDRPMRFS